MVDRYQQLADPNALADAGQLAQSPELWKALMALDAQRQTDQLVPPPRNPAAPADWAANAVRGAAGKIANMVTLPGRAMQQGITTEEAVPWATDTALNLAGGGAPMAERGAAGAFGGRLPTFEGPIRAYHSSPHDFEQFDLGKIGTGEGAQVYGHGIYAAENPAVSGRGGQYWNQFTKKFSPEEMDAAAMLQKAGFDREKALALAKQRLENARANIGSENDVFKMSEAFLPRDQAAHDLLASDRPIIGPRTYEIGINARPEEMLNWDKPLREQTPGVQEALGRAGIDAQDYILPSGQLSRSMKGPSVADLLKGAAGKAPQEMSAQLSDVGIPGVRYLDEGSRGASPYNIIPTPRGNYIFDGKKYSDLESAQQAKILRDAAYETERTRNYAIFDPKKIDIYRKYGMAGAVPAAGAAAYSQEDR